jgi:hypothetical protein
MGVERYIIRVFYEESALPHEELLEQINLSLELRHRIPTFKIRVITILSWPLPIA